MKQFLKEKHRLHWTISDESRETGGHTSCRSRIQSRSQSTTSEQRLEGEDNTEQEITKTLKSMLPGSLLAVRSPKKGKKNGQVAAPPPFADKLFGISISTRRAGSLLYLVFSCSCTLNPLFLMNHWTDSAVFGG